MEFPPCCKPTGRITNSCAAKVHRQQVDGHYQLTGYWTGWKLQGNKLIGPEGLRFTPQTLRNAWRKFSEPQEDDCCQNNAHEHCSPCNPQSM